MVTQDNVEKKSKKTFKQPIVTFCNIKIIFFTFVVEFAAAFANAVIPFIVRLSSPSDPIKSSSILLIHDEIAMKPSSPILLPNKLNHFNLKQNVNLFRQIY